MRQATKKELKAQNDALSRENHILLCALQDLWCKEVRQVHRFKEKEGGIYIYQVSSLTSPSGGYFWETFLLEGQRDHTAVHYLDDVSQAVILSDPTLIARSEAIYRAKALRAQELSARTEGG